MFFVFKINIFIKGKPYLSKMGPLKLKPKL